MVRIDPATGARTPVVDAPGLAVKAIDFSPDHTFLYLGTEDHSGNVYRVPLDAALDAAGPPELFANTGPDAIHDAVAVDWCGNVLVSDYWRTQILRVTPEGVKTVLTDTSFERHAHGIAWGSGVGGWRTDAIYVAQPFDGNTVQEIVIGVPGRSWTGN